MGGLCRFFVGFGGRGWLGRDVGYLILDVGGRRGAEGVSRDWDAVELPLEGFLAVWKAGELFDGEVGCLERRWLSMGKLGARAIDALG